MSYISLQKLKELKKELKERKTSLRQQIAKRIQEAQTQGDISENLEYAAAKEAQAFNEGRILELENLVRNAIVISKKRRKDIVQVGSQIVVKDEKGKKIEFNIVGSEDANPLEGKISNESPMGRSFLGHKAGDEINVQTPKGGVKYKIIRIK